MNPSLWIFLGSLLFLARQEEKRLPVPSTDAQNASEKIIRDVFKSEYAKTTGADKCALARNLMKQAAETKDEPVTVYVLLREARELAVQGGDLQTALAAINAVMKQFVVDGIGLKETALGNTARNLRTPDQQRELAQAYLDLSDGAAAAGDLDAALRAAQAGAATAKKAKELAIVVKAESKAKSLAELKNQIATAKKAEETLATKPDDPAANFVLGEFHCLVKGDWNKGLTFLAKGTDPAMKAAALKDLEKPSDGIARSRVGDAWWELAAGVSGLSRDQLRRRAAFWYEQALSELTGLLRVKVEKRLQEVSAESSNPADALPSGANSPPTLAKMQERLSSVTGRLKTADTPSTSNEAISQLIALAGEAIAVDEYDFSLKVLGVAEGLARKLAASSTEKAIQAKTLEVKTIQREWGKARLAVKTLESSPDDEKANFAAGMFFSTAKGDWTRAIGHFRKGSDLALRELSELDAQGPADSQERVKLAERWIEKSKQVPKFKERGVYWYKEAWPNLAGPDREKVRPRVAELQAVAIPQGKEWTPATTISGWSFQAGSGIGNRYAFSGKASARVAGDAGKRSWVMMERIPANPGKEFTLTLYALSEGMQQSAGSANIYWYRADGTGLGGPRAPISADFPFWQKLEIKAVIPMDADKTAFDVVIDSPTGAIWIDDISLVVDGKNLIRNGSFEDR